MKKPHNKFNPHKGVQVNLRLHPDLLKQIKRRAKRGRISMNAEISRRLSESLARESESDICRQLFERVEYVSRHINAIEPLVVDLHKELSPMLRIMAK